MSLEISPGGLHLIFAGALLFVLGLYQGMAIPMFKNSRMGLSAHLTAVQSGTAVIVLGVIWSLVGLSPFWLATAKWTLIAGNYFIWSGMTLAAITGASKALPIAGKGFMGSAVSERYVSGLILGGVGLSLLSGTLYMYGLGRTLLASI